MPQGSHPEPTPAELRVRRRPHGRMDRRHFVAVTADGGTTYAEESDRIDGGVARSFAVAVGTSGRHVVTVSGDDFRGELAWDTGVCRRFDGTVAVADGSVEVVGGCVEQR